MLSKKLMALMALSPTPTGPVGQQEWTTAGTYSFTVPADVTSICAVCIGAGGGGSGSGPTYINGKNRYSRISGGGGSLMYANSITVTPGEVLSIYVAPSVNGYYPGGASNVLRGADVLCQAGGGVFGASGSNGANIGTGGGLGGAGVNTGAQLGPIPQGGGGAGGYSGAGGGGGATFFAGAGGGGGGGGVSTGTDFGGGGVGVFGAGASGSTAGAGGSGGTSGTAALGGSFGGGAPCTNSIFYAGGSGAVRIIWGAGRSFPSTNTGDM